MNNLNNYSSLIFIYSLVIRSKRARRFLASASHLSIKSAAWSGLILDNCANLFSLNKKSLNLVKSGSLESTCNGFFPASSKRGSYLNKLKYPHSIARFCCCWWFIFDTWYLCQDGLEFTVLPRMTLTFWSSCVFFFFFYF